MILACAAVVAMITIANMLYWRSAQERRIRWQLYALRDQLRWAAIEDRSLLDSKLFWSLDRSLTRDCRKLDSLTLWTLLPSMLLMRGRRSELDEHKLQVQRELDRPQNASIAGLYNKSAELVLHHLVTRHIVLFVGLIATLIGPVLLLGWFRRLSKSIVRGDLRPVVMTRFRGDSLAPPFAA